MAVDIEFKGGPADGKTVRVGSALEALPYCRVAIPTDPAEIAPWRGSDIPDPYAAHASIHVYKLEKVRHADDEARHQYVYAGCDPR